MPKGQPAAKRARTEAFGHEQPSKPTFDAPAGKAGAWCSPPYGLETYCVHAGVTPDAATGAVLTPVFQSTTFVQESVEDYLGKGYSYSRTKNPTVEALGERITKLENGYSTALFSTGMAATITLMTATLNTGDHCIITECSYGGTNRACRKLFQEKYNISFTFCDFTKPEVVEAAIQKNTKLIFSETPANPVLTLTDCAAISKIAKKHGLIHACDTTFATPIMMRCLDHGCDYAVVSTTKYYDGHNMTVGGAIVSANKELDEKVRFWQNVHGNIMAPWTAFLQLQTSKTMNLRVKKQTENAQAIAEFLETHKAIDKVVYPGLKSFPQKELADRQHMNGLHGGMLWFEVKGGVEAGVQIMNTIERPWALCENLGASESIITCPAVFTHANMLKEDREKLGITDGFIRVSCGIEDAADLIKSLKKSLDKLLK
eukprot:TRINITY_DN3156_c0_g1_i1.p2 TRINITY_DN3156_c0_g1~~TRINITY_DN3156_c0_g1_i1.p2  ORF type:complete len:430 (+),score=160.93 TRINITY_DN3156_c0_g1_i1:65-1354(+)